MGTYTYSPAQTGFDSPVEIEATWLTTDPSYSCDHKIHGGTPSTDPDICATGHVYEENDMV